MGVGFSNSVGTVLRLWIVFLGLYLFRVDVAYESDTAYLVGALFLEAIAFMVACTKPFNRQIRLFHHSTAYSIAYT